VIEHGKADPQSGEARTGHARVADVLEALALRDGEEPWGVRELAESLGESRSTVNRILVGLTQLELAREHTSGKYGPGAKLKVLADAVLRRDPFMREARRALRSMSMEQDVTYVLALYDPTRRSYFRAISCEPATAFRYQTALGLLRPLSADFDGWAIAGYLGSGEAHWPHQVQRGGASGSAVGCVVFRSAVGHVATITAYRSQSQSSTGPDPRIDETLLHARQTLAEVVDRTPPTRPAIACDLERSAISRTIGLLMFLAGHPGGIRANKKLYDALLVSENAGRRLIASALACGSAIVAGDGTLHPGPQLLRIAARLGLISRRFDLIRPILKELVTATGETIGFVTYRGDTATAQIEETLSGWRPVQYRLETGVDIALYAGAAGKAVLAYCPEETISSQKLVKLTPNTPSDRERLKQELQTIRDRGWASGDGERIPDAFGVAVPYFIDGSIAGSVTATIPRDRKMEVDVPSIVSAMKEASRQISRLLSIQ
jgi:Transcriptional regulator